MLLCNTDDSIAFRQVVKTMSREENLKPSSIFASCLLITIFNLVEFWHTVSIYIQHRYIILVYIHIMFMNVMHMFIISLPCFAAKSGYIWSDVMLHWADTGYLNQMESRSFYFHSYIISNIGRNPTPLNSGYGVTLKPAGYGTKIRYVTLYMYWYRRYWTGTTLFRRHGTKLMNEKVELLDTVSADIWK